MEDVTISIRINKHIHDLMNLHDDINWSGFIRNSIGQKLEGERRIDKGKALIACREMDSLRAKRVFDKGRNSTEIIREWRGKRR